MVLGEIKSIEPKFKAPANSSDFVNKLAKIESVDMVDIQSPFGEDGKQLPKGETVPAKAIKVTSVALGKALDADGQPCTDKDGNSFDLKATELINMTKDDDGTWGVSTSERSNYQKFIKSLKIDHIDKAIGMELVVKEKKSGFLGFFY